MKIPRSWLFCILFILPSFFWRRNNLKIYHISLPLFSCMSSSDWLQSLIVIRDKKQPLHCAAPLTRKLSPFGATHRGNDLVSTNCGRKQPSSFCLMNHKETICLFKDHTFRLRRRLKQMRCQWGRFYLLWNSPLPSLLQKMRTRAACRVKF